MGNVKCRMIIFVLVFAIFVIAAMYIPHIYLYDDNSLFNFIHLTDTYNGKVNNVGVRKSYPLYIDKDISSNEMAEVLYFISSVSALNTVINNDFNRLYDNENVRRINDFLKRSPNNLGASRLIGGKGVGFIKGNYSLNEKIMQDYLFLNTANNFEYSHIMGDIDTNKVFDFDPDRKGIFIDKVQKSNIDIVYKMGRRYAFSLPFLIYLKNNTVEEIEKIKFEKLYVDVGNNRIFYDERGRCSFKGEPSLGKDIFFSKYSAMESAIKQRIELSNNIYKLGLLENKNEVRDYSLFIEEEKIIDNLYNIDDYKDEVNRKLLSDAKNIAASWKGFRNSYRESISGSIVFISDSDDIDWVKESLFGIYILEKGITIKRVHHTISFLITLVFFVLCFISSFYLPNIYGYLLSLTIIISNIILYFLAVNYLRSDFPVTVNVLYGFTGTFFGSAMKYFYFRLWNRSVRHLLGNNVSKIVRKEIAYKLRENMIDLNSGHKTATFLRVDVSSLLENDDDDSKIIYLKDIINKIELIIKNNRGVIGYVTPSSITGYFGVPLDYDNHVLNAINASYDLVRLGDDDKLLRNEMFISIHTKKEYFDLMKIDDTIRYSNFGGSITVLEGMTRVAKRFEVNILVTSNVVKMSNKKLSVRMFDRVKIKGYNKSERVFQLFTDDEYSVKSSIVDFFHAGLKLFESGMWEESSYYFRQCLKLQGDDIPSQIYLQRCKDFMYIPPKEGWDGVYEVE